MSSQFPSNIGPQTRRLIFYIRKVRVLKQELNSEKKEGVEREQKMYKGIDTKLKIFGVGYP